MTIPSNADPKAGPFNGNDSQTAFPFAFRAFLATDLLVVRTDEDGVEHALVPGSDYSVSLNGDQNANPGGTVTYPISGDPLPTGETLTIVSDLEYLQPLNLLNGGNFSPSVQNTAFDRVTMLVKQVKEKVSRALQLAVSTPAGVDVTLPVPEASKVIGWSADGTSLANFAADTSVSTDLFADRLADTSSASNGAGLSGFDWALNYVASTSGWGIRTALNKPNALRWMPVSEWANVLNGTSTTDLTTYIQTAFNNSAFFPQGRWSFSATTGITLADGVEVCGAGKARTIFWAISGTGGSSANLVAYGAGSCFKRSFNVAPGTNSYVTNVRLSDFGLILNHPTSGSITSTAIQIGIDLRNITRSFVERVHVGNVAPLGSIVAKSDPGAYAAQGYGIVIGNVSQSESSYCGGEVNTVRDCHVWGCYKGIVLDDATLSPNSAAHATVVENNDIQACHHLLVQEQQYTAGFEWLNNVLQNVITQPGGGGGTRYVMRVAGYNNYVKAGYIEAGSTDYLLRFDSASNANRVVMSHYGATTIATAAFSDAGRRNEVRAFLDTGTNAGGVDSLGAPLTRYDRAYASAWQKFNWDGAAIVNSGGFGLTVTRNGTGDYLATFALPFIDANSYTPSFAADTNASGHGGTFSIISQTANNIRFQCYGQNGGTTTAIDPRQVYIRVTQAQ